MERMKQALVIALLERLRRLGLLSDAACSRALERANAAEKGGGET